MLTKLPFSDRGDVLVGQEMFRVLERAKFAEKQGVKIFHLELGNPRLPPPPEIFEVTKSAIDGKLLGYTSSAGLMELRTEIAKRYTNKNDRQISEENVVVGIANLLISQFMDLTCNRGDKIVLFSPVFPTYLVAGIHAGLEVVDIPLSVESGVDLTRNDVDRAIESKPRAIIINSANNPTGRVYSREILEYLAKLCHKNGIWLMSDETYGEISYRKPFYSLSALNYPQLIVISSFSKIFSIPGFRTGFALANEVVAKKLELSNSTLISCLPIFTQMGCAAGLRVLDGYMKEVKDHYYKTTSEITNIIKKSSVISFSEPDAAVYIFAEISKTGLDDVEFSDLLLTKANTAVTPGRSFGEKYKNFIRIAICGNIEDVVEGVNRVVTLAEDLSLAKPK